jgi:hypothetical protein
LPVKHDKAYLPWGNPVTCTGVTVLLCLGCKFLWCPIRFWWFCDSYWHRLIRFRSVVLEGAFCVCYSMVGTSLHDVSGGGAVPVFWWHLPFCWNIFNLLISILLAKAGIAPGTFYSHASMLKRIYNGFYGMMKPEKCIRDNTQICFCI